MKRIISLLLVLCMTVCISACDNQEKYDENEMKIIESYDNMIEDARQEMQKNMKQLQEILPMIEEADSDEKARQIAAEHNPRGYSMEFFAHLDKAEVYEFIESQLEIESETFEETKAMFEAAKQENLEKYRNGTLIVE